MTILSSWIDKSVVFIWSHISVFKPYFLKWNFIWSRWLVMKQECIRNHNLKTLFDDDIIPRWWSCFTSLWSVIQPKWIKESCEILFRYLLDWLKIPLDNILVRISSKDKDLLDGLNSLWYNIKYEIDSKYENYYKHKLGLWNITGRNFNIALRHWNSNVFNDVWNVIVIEDENRIYTTEIALWFNTILMQLYWLDNIFQTTLLEKYYTNNNWLHSKLKDCIISSINLLNEWLRPWASNNKRKILRKYIRWILYFTKKIWFNKDEVFRLCESYEKDSFGTVTNTKFIREYINLYENDLLNKKEFSKEDRIIKDVISN